MTAQELIDATIGSLGMNAHDTLAMIFDDGDEYARAVLDVKHMLSSLGNSDSEKLILTLSQKQVAILFTFFLSGFETFMAIRRRSGKDAL